MYCKILEPGKQVIQYGSKVDELFFISKGSVDLYDKQGVIPFL